MPRGNPHSDTPRKPELPAIDWIRHAGAAEEVLRDAALKIRRRRTHRLRLAGCACAVVLGTSVSLRLARERPAPSPLSESVLAIAPPSDAPATAVSPATALVTRPATRTLPDGTIVELQADAEIAVAFTPALRRVTLVRGTAHFQVAKDSAHPFVVQASDVETRAVGTAFSVQHGARDVGVVVTEGRVRVTSQVKPDTGLAADTLPHAFVDAGLRCVVQPDATPRVESLPPALLAAELSWRIPQLEFSRAPLHEVIALVNANITGATYEIADPALRNIRLTGLLRADNTAGLERLLETSFHLHLNRVSGKVVISGPE